MSASTKPQLTSGLRASVEALPQLAWTANPDGGIDYHNQRWVDYTGMMVEEARSWGWGPVLHPDDLSPCTDRWRHACTTGTLFEFEYRFRRAADGAYRWHRGMARPIRDESGAVIKWVGSCADVHDQKEAATKVKRARDSARDAESRFRALHDASPDAFILLDIIADAAGIVRDARIVYANPAACALVDPPVRSLTGWILGDAFPDDRSSGRYELYAEVYRTGVTRETIYYHEAARKWLRTVVVKVANGFCITNVDVSELKTMEAELRRERDALEQLVAERTAELAAARDAADAAEAASGARVLRSATKPFAPVWESHLAKAARDSRG